MTQWNLIGMFPFSFRNFFFLDSLSNLQVSGLLEEPAFFFFFFGTNNWFCIHSKTLKRYSRKGWKHIDRTLYLDINSSIIYKSNPNTIWNETSLWRRQLRRNCGSSILRGIKKTMKIGATCSNVKVTPPSGGRTEEMTWWPVDAVSQCKLFNEIRPWIKKQCEGGGRQKYTNAHRCVIA